VRLVFADTLYWIAIFLPGDPWAPAAKSVDLTGARLITTEEVLAEFLTGVSCYGEGTRRTACKFVREILNDPGVDVVEQSHVSFLGGLALYEKRPDKQYSLTDCISMNVMMRKSVTEILTQDRHFSQEGFLRLLARKI
jgi:predicted nucleic acid-binding protein